MSIAEIKAEIPKLSLQEMRELTDLLREAQEDAQDIAAADAAWTEVQAGGRVYSLEEIKTRHSLH